MNGAEPCAPTPIVYTLLHRGCRLSRCARVDLAAIVLAIGQQDDDLAFRLRFAEAVDARDHCRADGSAVFDHTDFHRLEHLDQEWIVECQRNLGKGLRSEHDQANPV